MTKYNFELYWYRAEVREQLPEVGRPVFALVEEDVTEPESWPGVLKLVRREDDRWNVLDPGEDQEHELSQSYTVIRWRYCDGSEKG